jgi:hypothetical protein
MNYGIPTLEPSDRYGKNSLASGIISDALRLILIITLCRIWDNDGSVDSIPKLEKRLKQHVRHDAFEQWENKVAAVKESNQLCALLQFRHQGIGHRQDPLVRFKKPPSRKSNDDFEQTRYLLEKTIEVLGDACVMLNYNVHINFNVIRQRRNGLAKLFWDTVASAAEEKSG